jgi:hypothetical protein
VMDVTPPKPRTVPGTKKRERHRSMLGWDRPVFNPPKGGSLSAYSSI